MGACGAESVELVAVEDGAVLVAADSADEFVFAGRGLQAGCDAAQDGVSGAWPWGVLKARPDAR